MRVPVEAFQMSKSQRRVWRRNSDLTVDVGEPVADQERFALYLKYIKEWHGKQEPDDHSYRSFVSFLYESPVPTREYQYRDPAGKLIGVGICDVSDRWMSSVYFYHDPSESRRSLGTFSALYEIAECCRLGIPYYYLGYWVDGCATMAYKASYRPHQILEGDGVWRVRRDGGEIE